MMNSKNFIITFFMLILSITYCYGLEEKIIFTREFEETGELLFGELEKPTTEEEKKVPKRLRMDVSIGFGLINSIYSFFTEGVSDSEYHDYLDEIGMKSSETPLTLTIGLSYRFEMLQERFTAYISCPAGIIMEERMYYYPLTVGIGDFSGGFYITALREQDILPGILPRIDLQFEVNTKIADYISLGDGFYNLIGGVTVTKWFNIGDIHFSLFGNSSYNYRLDRDDIEPGPIISYKGGLTILLDYQDSGETPLTAWFAKIWIGQVITKKSEKNNVVILSKQQDMRIGFSLLTNSIEEGAICSCSFILAGIDQGFELDASSIGVYLSCDVPLQ